MTPLIVVEGGDGAVADALAEVKAAGWTVVPGWWTSVDETRVVCTGAVSNAEEAAAALLAAVAGAGLVVAGRADRDVLDRLCDDLRHLGRLDHRTASDGRRPQLTAEERSLVELLLEGCALGEAARRLGLSRRTADRRMASVRGKLGVTTTPEALVAVARRGTGA